MDGPIITTNTILPPILDEIVLEMARDIDVFRGLLAIPVFVRKYVGCDAARWQKWCGIVATIKSDKNSQLVPYVWCNIESALDNIINRTAYEINYVRNDSTRTAICCYSSDAFGHFAVVIKTDDFDLKVARHGYYALYRSSTKLHGRDFAIMYMFYCTYTTRIMTYSFIDTGFVPGVRHDTRKISVSFQVYGVSCGLIRTVNVYTINTDGSEDSLVDGTLEGLYESGMITENAKNTIEEIIISEDDVAAVIDSAPCLHPAKLKPLKQLIVAYATSEKIKDYEIGPVWGEILRSKDGAAPLAWIPAWMR